MPVGEKGSMAMTRPFPDMIKNSISDIGSPCNYPTIMAISDQVMRESEGYDKIVIYYNEFKSAISQIIRRMELMPRKRFLETMKFSRLYSQKLPDKNTSTPSLYELYLTSNLWVAFLNNAASEQSARMSAMENASKNAGEIVNKLNAEVGKLVKRTDIIERLHKQGIEPGSMAPEAFAQLLRQDFERMAKVFKTSGAKAD
jgi:ATP synthase F1 gamma subunit